MIGAEAGRGCAAAAVTGTWRTEGEPGSAAPATGTGEGRGWAARATSAGEGPDCAEAAVSEAPARAGRAGEGASGPAG